MRCEAKAGGGQGRLMRLPKDKLVLGFVKTSLLWCWLAQRCLACFGETAEPGWTVPPLPSCRNAKTCPDSPKSLSGCRAMRCRGRTSTGTPRGRSCLGDTQAGPRRALRSTRCSSTTGLLAASRILVTSPGAIPHGAGVAG